MRILHVIARLNEGGTARYLGVLSDALASVGVDHRIALGFVQGSESEDPITRRLPVERVPALGRKLDVRADMVARRQLSDTISQYKPDIIHTHTFKAGLLGRTLRSDIPHVHSLHGNSLSDPEFAGFKSRVLARVEGALARYRTDALIAISEQVAREHLEEGVGRNLDSFTIIYPGVEPVSLVPRAQAKDRLGITRDSLTVAWLARFVPVKAPHRVLELAHAFPEITFIMAGDGPLMDSIRAAAPANVVIPGWIDAGLAYGAADMALLTSDSEGIGISVIEAQLAGLPVVATRVGGLSEVIEDEVSGVLTSPQGLAMALRRLADSAELRDRLGTAAIASAQKRFSVDAMLERHLTVYERVLANRN